MPQMVVIAEVLVAQRQSEARLADQRADRMLDQLGIAMILEAPGELVDQSDRPIRRAQQEAASIRYDHSAVERRLDSPTFNRCKAEQIRDTLCRHRRSSFDFEKRCGTTLFSESARGCTSYLREIRLPSGNPG